MSGVSVECSVDVLPAWVQGVNEGHLSLGPGHFGARLTRVFPRLVLSRITPAHRARDGKSPLTRTLI